MKAHSFNQLHVGTMASGHLFLNLSDIVAWEDFPDFVGEFLQFAGGQTIEKTDSVDLRIWTITVGGKPLRVVYEDYPQMVSVESSSADGDRVINDLFSKLSALE